MDLENPRYNRFALCREMLETPAIIASFNPALLEPFLAGGQAPQGVLLTGEGSSRLFPAKQAIWRHRQSGHRLPVFTEGASQALEYPLAQDLVVGLSNSGRTKELIRLFTSLQDSGHPALFGITAGTDSPLAALTRHTQVLACGPEAAVAASKSVMEQAIWLDALLSQLRGEPHPAHWFPDLANQLQSVLALPVPPEMVAALAGASRVYFAGRSNGVAEELTLKTNEIIRKPSAYLEGTYALHGIEEVMEPTEVVLIVDPWESEEAMFETRLAKGIGLTVMAIGSRPTRFPTLVIPHSGNGGEAYLQLAAGWSLLAEAGISLGLDLDAPRRARKIGNEW